jgi:hypothetical protein
MSKPATTMKMANTAVNQIVAQDWRSCRTDSITAGTIVKSRLSSRRDVSVIATIASSTSCVRSTISPVPSSPRTASPDPWTLWPHMGQWTAPEDSTLSQFGHRLSGCSEGKSGGGSCGRSVIQPDIGHAHYPWPKRNVLPQARVSYGSGIIQKIAVVSRSAGKTCRR